MELNDLSPEARERARACRTPEELVELANEEGVELSDEQLEAVSGGWGCSDYEFTCDRHSKNPHFDS